MLQGSMFTKRT